MAQLIETPSNLADLISQSDNVFVEFYSKTCGPCKLMDFILKAVAEELPDDFLVIQVDFDKAGSMAKRYNISSYPTVIYFEKGIEVTRDSGVMQKQAILNMIEGDK